MLKITFEMAPSIPKIVPFRPIATSTGTATTSIIPVAIRADTNLHNSGHTTDFFQLLLQNTHILFVTNANEIAQTHDKRFEINISADICKDINLKSYGIWITATNIPYVSQLTSVVIPPQKT